jgi:putative acetyltransferase
MAVVPDAQRRGIGTRLVEAGNARLAASGCPYIVVLGHPEFYPRFGFDRASRRGITCAWDVPDDVFMVLVLDEARMAAISGPAVYRSEFTTVT